MLKRSYVPKNSRHIRWNWESSPEDPERLVRYHIVIVDDRNREGILNHILEPIQAISSGIVVVKRGEGKVKDSRFKYEYYSVDTVVCPEVVTRSTILGKSIRRDRDLKERRRGTVEDYVADVYEK